MDELINILPEAFLFLASGFAFVCGFYFFIDRRFDFFSEISFMVILVIGFTITNTIQLIPTKFTIQDKNLRNILIIVVSLIIGIFIAVARNTVGPKITNFVIKVGRKKSSSTYFWYDRLDTKDKPLWIRLISYEKQYILEGVLLSLSEEKDNPYILLGYCSKYNLNGIIIDSQYCDDECIQIIVHPDNYDETILFYDKDSSKCIDLKIGSQEG